MNVKNTELPSDYEHDECGASGGWGPSGLAQGFVRAVRREKEPAPQHNPYGGTPNVTGATQPYNPEAYN